MKLITRTRKQDSVKFWMKLHYHYALTRESQNFHYNLEFRKSWVSYSFVTEVYNFTQQLWDSKQTETEIFHCLQATKTIHFFCFSRETYIPQSNKSYGILVFAHLHLVFSLFQERIIYDMKAKKKLFANINF